MRTLAIAAVLAAATTLASAQPLGTSFTYQGRLTDAGNPASGAYDLQLALFDAATGGAQVGSTLTRDDVAVANGLFTVTLDFGATFTGAKRFLQLGVRPGVSTGAYTTLGGRQELTPSPNALFSSAAPWTGVSGKPAGFADDVDNDALGALSCPNGQIPKRVGVAWACADDADSGGDITGVTAGTGLTGGGTSGAVTVSANLAGSGIASTIARSDHDHFTQSWSGSGASGLTVTNAGGAGLRGLTTSTGTTPGVFGSSQSTAGVGVHGVATATTGQSRGVHGEAASSSGAGVFGTNTSSGPGVTGVSTATSLGVGVFGRTDATIGSGVVGRAESTVGSAMGVQGVARAPGGWGVWGYASSTTGPTVGVVGTSWSPDGFGAFFENHGGGPALGVNGGIRFSDGTIQTTAAVGDITGVTAGSGLTGGGTSGNLTLGVAFGTSGASTSVSRADHDHLNQSWSGSAPAFQTLHVTNTATGGFSDGIFGQSEASGGGRGLVGYAPMPVGANYGVWGQADSTSGRGVFGIATAATGASYGVYGENSSTTGGAGVFGRALGTGPVSGIEGRANTANGNAIYGQNDATSGGIGVAARGHTAIYGEAVGNLGGTGVYGLAPQVGGDAIGVRAQTQAQTGKGLWAIASNANGVNYAIYAENAGTNSYAGYFTGLPGFGRVHVTGTLSKGMGSFKIDHPLDPENKYLYHSFVESPDMMNIYNGNVVTDADGYATVELPDWFEALNREFRYQLTVVDEADSAGFVQAKVVRKVAEHRFTLRTSAPRVEVSWQVTGIRHDAIAEKHRIPVEEDKPEAERGKYLYPVEQGQPPEKGLDWERSATALARREASGAPSGNDP